MWKLTETLDLNLHHILPSVAATRMVDGIISRCTPVWSVHFTQERWVRSCLRCWCFQTKTRVSESGTWLSSSWQECHCSQEEAATHHRRGPAAWGWPHSYCVLEDFQWHFNRRKPVRTCKCYPKLQCSLALFCFYVFYSWQTDHLQKAILIVQYFTEKPF